MGFSLVCGQATTVYTGFYELPEEGPAGNHGRFTARRRRRSRQAVEKAGLITA